MQLVVWHAMTLVLCDVDFTWQVR